jgi:hypothetical protein
LDLLFRYAESQSDFIRAQLEKNPEWDQHPDFQHRIFLKDVHTLAIAEKLVGHKRAIDLSECIGMPPNGDIVNWIKEFKEKEVGLEPCADGEIHIFRCDDHALFQRNMRKLWNYMYPDLPENIDVNFVMDASFFMRRLIATMKDQIGLLGQLTAEEKELANKSPEGFMIVLAKEKPWLVRAMHVTALAAPEYPGVIMPWGIIPAKNGSATETVQKQASALIDDAEAIGKHVVAVLTDSDREWLLKWLLDPANHLLEAILGMSAADATKRVDEIFALLEPEALRHGFDAWHKLRNVRAGWLYAIMRKLCMMVLPFTPSLTISATDFLNIGILPHELLTDAYDEMSDAKNDPALFSCAFPRCLRSLCGNGRREDARCVFLAVW